MKQQKSIWSVNCCTHCKKQLTLMADKLGKTKCAQCDYFDGIGVYTIQDYNEYLNQNNEKLSYSDR